MEPLQTSSFVIRFLLDAIHEDSIDMRRRRLLAIIILLLLSALRQRPQARLVHLLPFRAEGDESAAWAEAATRRHGSNLESLVVFPAGDLDHVFHVLLVAAVPVLQALCI